MGSLVGDKNERAPGISGECRLRRVRPVCFDNQHAPFGSD
jgi:hypothetical protein